MTTADMSPADTRMTSILGINYVFDERGVATIEQGYDMGNDGDVARIELHPIFLRLLAEEAGLVGKPSAGMVPDSVVARLCMLKERLSSLHGDLLADDRPTQPYQTSEPYVMAGLILEDLDQLVEEFGPRRDHATPSNASGSQVTPTPATDRQEPLL